MLSDEAPDSVTHPGAPTRVRGLVVVLFLVIAASAAVALFVQPRVIQAVRNGSLDELWLFIGPAGLTLAVLVAAVQLLRASKRRFGRSLLQIGVGVATLAFVLTQSALEFRTRKAPPAESAELLQQLMKSGDARVRALVVEVASRREPSAAHLAIVKAGENDRDPRVKAAARLARDRVHRGVP